MCMVLHETHRTQPDLHNSYHHQMKTDIHIWFGLPPALFTGLPIIPMVATGLLLNKVAANDGKGVDNSPK